jgi:hypothetical protein
MTGVTRQRLAGFVLSLGCLVPTPAFAEKPHGTLPCAADGTCTTNRLTYGYYPTRWRKWPIPAPVVQQRTKQPGRAAAEPEKAEPAPRGGTTEQLEEKKGSPLDDNAPVPPKDSMDTPPEMPSDIKSDLPQPGERDLPKLLPDVPGARPELPGLNPPKPNKPSDDDPFKDEPPLEGSPTPAMPRENSGVQSIRWRTAPTMAVRNNMLRQGAAQTPVEEPELLPEPTLKKAAALPREEQPAGKTNPLRTASYDADPAEQSPVAAATGWTEDRSSKAIATPVGFVNPLRGR